MIVHIHIDRYVENSHNNCNRGTTRWAIAMDHYGGPGCGVPSGVAWLMARAMVEGWRDVSFLV